MAPSPQDAQRVAAIRERLEAATPGPWEYDEPDPNDEQDDGVYLSDGSLGRVAQTYNEGNGKFIATAPADIAYLLALVQRQAEALETVASELEAEAVIADRPGQMERLETLARWLREARALAPEPAAEEA